MASNITPISQSKQRVLIFQGGGALGAYEAGIFKALHDNFYEKDENKNRAMFDIVAGTSAGAINAVLLVNYVIQNGTWKDSANILTDFWKDVSTSTWYFENPFMDYWQDTAHSFRDKSNKMWEQVFEPIDDFYNKGREKWPLLPFYYYWPDKYGPLATAEATRRYRSWLQFAQTPLGTPSVLSPAILQPDFRFFNPFTFMLRYDNTPITETILRYWRGEGEDAKPIKTKDGQPRLLIVGVDVQDATTVTFDSYPKEDGRLMSVYGDEDKVKHEIYYDDGIEMKHLLATMSSHLRHKLPELEVKTTFPDGTIEEKSRPFMDGIYLSNTPLREVLQAHRDYHDKVIKKGKDIPSLDIIIGDLYPTLQKGTPLDPDSINNRVQDVLFHDKSKFDEKSAILVSDYIGISKILWNHIENKDKDAASQLKIEIDKVIRSKDRKGDPRKFDDLINGRFTIDNLVRIEYGNNQPISESDDINGKAFEFSSHTIRNLVKTGEDDTLNYRGMWESWLR
jgi:NTE family protein